ncbi:MAG: proline dehydrogenase family protein [Bryobacteraceae bacterium]
MLRETFLFLSRRRALRRWMETSPAAARLTRRFIAGRRLEDVIAVALRLQQEGILSTLDHLGENVTSREEAEAARACIEDALDAIARSSLNSTVSIKLTQFGLDISDSLCRANVESVLLKARAIRSRVEIDMESSQYVDPTLRIVEDLHSAHNGLRAVLQAYLYRTHDDLRRLNSLRIPVRLCKGAYKEPHTVAWPRKRDVDSSYARLARLMLDEGEDPAFATHDPRMIDIVVEHAARSGRSPSTFEFQMLYGVRRDLQRMLVSSGYRLRLYVPYGDAWYPYFMRRLAERPANLFFILRNLARQ